jgi:hypothetical protein
VVAGTIGSAFVSELSRTAEDADTRKGAVGTADGVEMRDIGHSLDVLRRAIAARLLGVNYASRQIF